MEKILPIFPLGFSADSRYGLSCCGFGTVLANEGSLGSFDRQMLEPKDFTKLFSLFRQYVYIVILRDSDHTDLILRFFRVRRPLARPSPNYHNMESTAESQEANKHLPSLGLWCFVSSLLRMGRHVLYPICA